MEEKTESDKFDAGVRKILSVSRKELERREKQWQRERARKKQKSMTSASGHASRAKD